MRARVSFILADGSEVSLHPGDIVGRSAACALCVDDIRVSEAHALVSLRGGQLKLLALRGLLATGKSPVREVVLEPGMTVRLAKDVSLGVSSVEVPGRLLAVEGDDLPRRVLMGQSASLTLAPEPELVAGYVDNAEAHIWSNGERWWLRLKDEERIELTEGTHWDVGSRRFRAVSVPVEKLAAASTRHRGKLHQPLKVLVQFDTAAIHREGVAPLGLGGLSARILSELVDMDGPAHWSLVAKEVWRDSEDEAQLRHRWDRSIARLRKKLRDAGVRPDLVRADGTGTFEIFLYDGDEVESRT